MTLDPAKGDLHPAPDDSGVEFGTSADGLSVARIGDLAFAMVPSRDGSHFLASAWRVPRPLMALRRGDFCSHHGRVENDADFRARMLEQAEHSRELGKLARQTARINCSTPWGVSQGATVYAEGVVSHTTAGHGGFKLSAECNARVSELLREPGGWYEEDAAWSIVATTFPDLFTAYERKIADQTLRDSWPDAWEAIYGRTLGPGESQERDRRAFQAERAADWIVISAIVSRHHPGMTEVIATVGGSRATSAKERRFLVPNDEYLAGQFGFVIDEARHVHYGPSSFAGYEGRAR
jgi:hypothetical protein